jgi:DNA-binding transcriptional LysR family regulator
MDTIQNMRFFVKVAEEGSFTGGALRLNTSAAKASRSISELETHLRTRLLNRTTRHVALTEAGERYLRRCEQILRYVEEAELEAADAQGRPYGRLRVHGMASFGQYYLVPALANYHKLYPSVLVDLTLSQRVPDLLEDGYDLALQFAVTELPDSSLVSQRLGEVHSVLCASPAYLRARGMPRQPAELNDHTCLQLTTAFFSGDEWRLHGPNGEERFKLRPTPLQINVADALAVAAREGMGIAGLPLPTALPSLQSGALVRVLPEYRLHRLNAYALYSSRQYLDAKIKTFVDFLRETIPSALAADEATMESLPPHRAIRM